MKTTYPTLPLALLISACLAPALSAGEVKAYPVKGVNLAQFKTYQWYPPRVLTKSGIDENNPANALIKEVIGQQLAAIGLIETASAPDLMIQVWVLTTSVPQLEAVIMAEGPGMDYGTVVATMGRYNRQGTLYLNMINPKTKKSAWFALATESLNNGTLSPEQAHAKLLDATTAMFKKYPIKPPKK